MEEAKTIVSGNKVFRPLLDETLTTEDLRVLREELNETPETREVALKVLKKLLSEQDEFLPRMDDMYLIRFLRCRKYDDHKGRAVYVLKISRWVTNKISYADFIAAGNLVAENVLDNPVTQINGYIGIWDFKGFSTGHFLPFCLPKHIILLTTLMQDRFPARFKIAYCVNCRSLVNTAWNLFKPLMKEKFRHRVQILGSDMTELHKFIDPCILPVEYGGKFVESKEIAQRVFDKEQAVKYNSKFGFL
ncbi:alpha-tocopherol transfer protein-like [Trichonephila clavata]|uniref:Alpha-tocopherol transfer protein-like n=1 Tax=Trichonephila clavata TaxID=2740835 RepID=A0A8X6HLF8_TRICU|nr:alpha-tocopherol transfer protein-like [Trichonephila clavata]